MRAQASWPLLVEHEILFDEQGNGELFETLMELPRGTSTRFHMLARPGYDAGRIIFIEYQGLPDDVVDTLVGRGRMARVRPPFGTTLEIWEST